ncbi:MAG TPA: SLC13 family permease [Xanthomonadales bacterium]|nr:SLC13 family permease [Xanthomonadales bacterium]
MNFPLLPNEHALAVLIMTVLALYLFTREKIPLETSSLLVLLVLVVGFELFPYRTDSGPLDTAGFFHGFGHEALVAVCALMIAGQALVRTGALEPVARRLARFWRWSPLLAMLVTLLVAAVLSAFMNNTPIVVLMLPMLIGAAVRNESSSSGVLLPMGLATLIGGMGTTIGTSTNLLVVSVAADMGMERFEMFDFMVPVLIAGGVAMLYLWLIAPRLIPERQPPLTDQSSRVFHAQLAVPDGHRLIGKPLAAVFQKAGKDLQVLRLLRGENLLIAPLPDVRLQAGDKLEVSDTADMLKEFQSELGFVLIVEEGMAPDTEGGDLQLAEVAVTGGSRLHGMRLGDANLKQRYGLDLIALHGAGGATGYKTPGLLQRKLRASDVLLVQGRARDISALKRSGELLVLDATTDLPHTSKAFVALLVMVMVIALAAFGILPIHISATLGCFALIISGCLSWRDATQALSVQVILIIVASLALGSALMKTGGADYMAQVFLFVTLGLSPPLVLALLMLLMAILTNIVSNNAAAVIGTPIAISIAMELGLPLEPFVLAVLFGANLSFVTPMAYKTNLLVMNAGGYKFGDFVRVGTPLTLIMWLVLSVVLASGYQL